MKHLTFIAACTCAFPIFADSPAHQLDQINAFFKTATIVSGPSLVDCTLSRGTKTSCFQITVKPTPQSYTPGPWCPTDVTDGADKGGIWLDDGKVHTVDGAFVGSLAKFYDDDAWDMVDANGKVKTTDTKAACEAAARPDVDPQYYNHCVQCLPEYMATDASMTYTIPLTPQRTWRTNATTQNGSGLAYNGVRLDGPAPVDAILSANTIAPFDDCGGHVNTHVGYHYHAATDCLIGDSTHADHAAKIGIAMDGYAIFAHALSDQSTPQDLDKCNGHDTADLGYHYHAGAPGSNAILGCMRAQTGCASETPGQACDASARRPRP